jgi:Thiamine pyrophosphate-requiring enzymes [acetolactate synthase, pyruvate dehydrogenase (cytochrome), glyoxylate carboligase, phosphonopyruvate decarboxylase]
LHQAQFPRQGHQGSGQHLKGRFLSGGNRQTRAGAGRHSQGCDRHQCAYHYPDKISLRSYKPTVKGHPGQVRKAMQMIASAQRPMFYTGGGDCVG